MPPVPPQQLDLRTDASSRPPVSFAPNQAGLPPGRDPRSDEPTAPIPGAPVRVLLVEDNPGDQELVAEYLAEADVHHVLTLARRVSEATVRLQTEAFDVIVLDLHLPDGVALNALTQIQAAAASTPIVVLTGMDDAALARECLAAGADDYIPKATMSTHVLERALGYACARAAARDLRRRLEHADRLTAVGKLAVTVAHEINNPTASLTLNLGAFEKFLEGLDREIKDHPDAPWPGGLRDQVPALREAAADCLVVVDRITNIVRNLRALARSGTEHPAWVDVREICRRVCSVVGAQIRERASLVTDLQEVSLLYIPERKLEQVLVNLLVNAAQAIPPGAIPSHRVLLSTFERDGQVTVRVEDTGRGMPPKVLERIFEPFFSTKDGDDGTGLGLSVSGEIIARLGGRIAVSSDVGRGSVFSVVLPVPPPGTGLGAPATRGPEGRRRKILFVDDDAALVRSIQRALGAHHDVHVAVGGAQALDILAAGTRFDAVLCDLVMPGVDGRAVYRIIEQFLPELLPRVAFVSGAAATAQAAEFVRTRNVHIIAKPASVRVLLEVIETLCAAGDSAVAG